MSKHGASSTSTSPPAGSGTVAGMGESFSLDLNSGQGTYSLPFDVPEGVAGQRPSVKLEYRNSNANGPFGLGWALQQRIIERRLDLGAPEEGGQEVYLDSGVELRRTADGRFVPLREMAFSHYAREGDGWVIHERDGSRHFFGTSAAARVADPDHPDRVQSWLLERQEDASGNAISYHYTRVDGYPYLSEIRYAKFVIRFEYEPRPDRVIDGRAGFVRRITQRCRAIRLHLAVGNRAVRTLALSYESAPLSGVSLLVSAQLTAHGEGQPDVVKNPVTLSYSGFDPQQIEVDWIASRPGDPQPPPLTDPDAALLVLDDLPLPGILANRNGRQTYWPYDGHGGWALPRRVTDTPFVGSFQAEGVQFVDMDGTGRADMLVGIGGNPLNGYYANRGREGLSELVLYPRQARALPPFESGRVRLGELDGDGVVDALYSAERGLVSYTNHGREGWSEPAIAARPAEVSLADPLTFLADMTGDGMPDLVQVRSGEVVYWVNVGHGRFGERVAMADSPRLAGITRDPGQLLLMDVDGDGCSDLVRVSAQGIELHVNRSGLGFAPVVRYPVLPIPLPETVRAVDVEGRGAAGILYNSQRAGQVGYVRFAWAQRPAPYLLQGVDNGNGLTSEIEYAPLVEMALADRAERPWDTTMPFPIWLVSALREHDMVRGRRTEVRYRYHDGHFDPLFRRFQGFREVEQVEVGDESRADVLTRYTFLMDQGAVPGNSREHAHLDRMLARAEVYSLDGADVEGLPYRVEETDYGIQELETLPEGDKRVFAFVRSTRKRYPERTGDERVEERTLEYDAFGNVSREVTRGLGTRDGAPVPEKEVATEVTYATDANRRVFKLARTVKRDSAGRIVMQMQRFYDGLPLGQLSAGLMTREEHLVLSLAAFSAHYAGMDAAALGYIEQPDADGVPAVFALEVAKTYTPQGNVASETTGVGRTTTKVYDADHLHVVQEITNGKTSRRVNDPVSGKPVELIAPSGARVRMQYDAFGRITAFMVADDTPANPTRARIYDDASVPNAITNRHRIDATRSSRVVIYYDGAGKEVQQRAERAPGEVVVSGWLEQNPWQQTKAEHEPTLSASLAFSVPSLAGRASRRTRYDGEGRPVHTVNYNGGVGSARFTPFEITTLDANDHDPGSTAHDTPRREEVDVWNHRTAVAEMGEGGGVVRTRFTVGLFGELLELAEDAGAICTYTYDRRGNLIRLDHRDAGLREQWFNSHNEVVRTRDARGNDVRVSRDAEGRVTTVELNGAVVEQFTYDDATPGADGRLVDAQYPEGRQQFTYTGRGFLAQHRVTVGSRVLDLGYEYDDRGRQTAIVYPDGTRLTRAHTGNGLAARIEGIVDAFEYDARNLPTRIAFSNGVTTEVEYEPGIGHVRRQRTVGPNGAVLEDVTFSYDELMQLAGRVETAPGVEREERYAYDPLNQLRRVDSTDAGGTSALDYAYSGGYNLAQVGESGWQLAYGDAARPDRVTAIARPGEPLFATAHDANGNLAALPGKQMVYNFKNQLAQVTLDDGAVVRYDYDYRGNRVRRRVTRGGATDETIYLGRLVEIHGGQETHFCVLDRRRIAMLRGGQTRWFHLDPLGTARFFSDENGTRIAQLAYHAFGVQRARSGAPPAHIFALHDLDEETGLVYMGYRWYAPQAGRFLTPDPLYLYRPERSEGDPVRLRLYTYAGNRPLDWIDPVGLSFWSVVGAIVGVIVGVVVAVAVVAAFATGIGFGILAVVGVIGLVTVSYIAAHALQGSGAGEFFRGFMIGLNAGLNATILTMMGAGVLGGVVGTLIFLSAFDTVAGSEVYQGILGWSNWLMPMSWLVIGIGAAAWILNGLGHLIFWEIPNLWGGGIQDFRITGFRMDWSTGMLATRGGWVANANQWDTAFNLGTFSYVDANATGWHMDHEAGHNLNLAVFGSIFHFVGFVHEIGGGGGGAFSEVLADSNDGGPGMWRP